MISNELLKKKIISKAIQGKLVNNDSSLKPVEIDEIKEEIPFEIPLNWKWVSFKKGFDLKQGTQIDLEKQSMIQTEDKPLQFLRIIDFTQKNNDIRFVSKEYSDYWIDETDIAMVRYGTPGFVCFGKSGVLANNLFRIIPKKEMYNKYLYYLLKSDLVQDKIVSHSVALSAIKFSDIYKLIVPIPPIEEQKRISDTIDELFELIDKKEKNDIEKEKLKSVLKEKILDSAIHGILLRNDDELNSIDVETIQESPFDIPCNWKWSCFGKMADKITDGTHSTPKYTTSGVPFLSVKDMSNGKLSFNSCKYISKEEHDVLYKRCDPKKGDLLITKVGTTGVPVIVDVDFEFSLFVSVALLRFNDTKFYNKYLKYVVETRFIQNIIDENTKGMANKNWVIKKISETPIPVPPLEEQKRIVEKIESLFELIEQL